jgi:hypothetical protein
LGNPTVPRLSGRPAKWQMLSPPRLVNFGVSSAWTVSNLATIWCRERTGELNRPRARHYRAGRRPADLVVANADIMKRGAHVVGAGTV